MESPLHPGHHLDPLYRLSILLCVPAPGNFNTVAVCLVHNVAATSGDDSVVLLSGRVF